MSHVSLLAAHRPMPLYESGEERHRVVHVPGHPDLHVTEEGFSLRENSYYRSAVEALGLEMAPYRYELDLRDTEHDLICLRRYLDETIRPGESIELWDLWVGSNDLKVCRFWGRLADFDLDTLKQLQEQAAQRQTCLTIEY